MSQTQRALSTRGYYDAKAEKFISRHSDYQTKTFKNFISIERDRLQSGLKKEVSRKNKKSIDSILDTTVATTDDTIRFIFPLVSAQTLIYLETLHSDLGCYFSILGEDPDTPGLECVSQEVYYERFNRKYNLKTTEEFNKFTKRQKMIESLAFISALLRKFDEQT